MYDVVEKGKKVISTKYGIGEIIEFNDTSFKVFFESSQEIIRFINIEPVYKWVNTFLLE